MRLTIIKPDGTVGVEGEFRHVDLSSIDQSIHAVQWNETTGHIEYNDGTPNSTISDIADYAGLISAWVALTPAPPSSPTLAELKLAKRQEINALRDLEEGSGFTYLGAVLDSDQASVIRIGVAVQAASLNPNFTVDWTTLDNGVLTMNQAEMLALPAALATFGATLHYKARALKAQVEAASTPEEVAAITW